MVTYIFTILATGCDVGVSHLESTIEQELGISHEVRGITHSEVGLTSGNTVIELIAFTVLNDNLYRITSCTGTDSNYLDLCVLWYCDLIVTVGSCVIVNTIDVSKRIEFGTHKLCAGYVNISQISQCRHTHLIVAIIIKSAIWYLVIIVLIIIFTEEVDVIMTCSCIRRMTFVDHNLLAQ